MKLNLNLKKINWRHPKYMLPMFLILPVIFLAYTIWNGWGRKNPSVEQSAVDQINMELPEARVDGVGDKLSSMTSRYNKENAFTVIDGIGTEVELKESIDDMNDEYNNELEAMILEAERAENERRLQELQRQINQSSYQVPQSKTAFEDDGYNAYLEELERIKSNSMQRQREISQQQDHEELMRQEAEKKAREAAAREAEERETNRPLLVSKASDYNKEYFNTVTSDFKAGESALIRAMIDKTTKAHEGTRLRFKLLDAVNVGNIRLLKGTYLYGTISGFSRQRVLANINSILVGDQFLKVDLSVFDNDGMEGFYVPESAFREFMKQAGSNVLGQNMQFSSYGYGSSVNGESLALQALQNIYSAGTNALSANIRKNKAKIKYNTIVYLINSKEAK